MGNCPGQLAGFIVAAHFQLRDDVIRCSLPLILDNDEL